MLENFKQTAQQHAFLEIISIIIILETCKKKSLCFSITELLAVDSNNFGKHFCLNIWSS